MKTLTSSLVLFALLVLATTILAEVVPWQQCPNSDPNAPVNCTVYEVRVDPCPEATSQKPCRLKRGRKASISFDFTPNFSGGNLQSRAFWANEIKDIPFLGMETDACSSTTCPATAGSNQTYTYELKISKNFPSRTYNVKWKLWNEEQKECCFNFYIKLYK